MAIDVFKTKSACGIVEGDYTTWKKKWSNEIPENLYDSTRIDFYINEDNKVIVLSWAHPSGVRRFAIINLSDFSTKFMSPTSPDYTYTYAKSSTKSGIIFGNVSLNTGGISHSLKTYFLILRADARTVEIWKDGSTPLWVRDVKADFLTTNATIYTGMISLTGCYIIFLIKHKGTNRYYLMLYEGF